MTKQLLAGAAAFAVVLGLGLSAAYANPTAKQNDDNHYSAIGNVENVVVVGIGQDASADGDASASADYNSYGSWADAWAGAWGGWAGDNYATVNVNVETDNVAIISENELYAEVYNDGSVYAGTEGGGCWYYNCWGGDADAATGSASQNGSQQSYAAGMFNNALNTGLGNGQQQGNTVGLNANTINF